MKVKLFPLVAVAMLSTNVMAAKWEAIGVGGENTLLYVDATSISSSKGLKKAWLRYSYTTPQKGDYVTKFKDYRSVLTMNHFDCAGRRSAVSKQVIYEGDDGTGEVLGTNSIKNVENALDDVTPGTLGETALIRVCGK
ncbi:hypothetical protein CMPELA_31095 [Cupriavidus necator]|uniref:Hypothetical membrane associated protein n=1 Tax=Cupriavidus necator (strain ATCC 17699 / DSM 428 / KCTC 22496 / NCIMB 10442 / H16 / Stanier 337) TaxID=381666 RepID=Q0JYJ7_CUPNH|nr:surface-adhesin E family protein [Cupriavidus necator]QCC04946.1 hypothetical protein E6A55_31265 [Cupriavidus necator H16]QQB79633.1 hypothetical protein I6H87_30815 [Cupriavidus necator]WKA43876.1 hypothetical protein QWP09_31295 [Cupriavidus necator]CAJ97177.1 hypothetical membrane associated protein [Cupriavidus necator H16]